MGLLDTGEFSTLRLVVGLYDTFGQVLYSGQGGIGARSALVNKHFVTVDLSSLLSDEARMRQAVDIAVAELAGRPGSEKAPLRQVSIGNLAPHSTPPAEPETAVHATRTDIQTTVKTIAILPIDVTEVGQAESIRALYHNRLTRALESAGYNVLSRWMVQQTYKDAAERAGGPFDPITGAAIEDRLAKASEIRTRILRDQYHVDAVLSVSFPTVGVPFDNRGSVEWDGVSRSAFPPGTHIDRFEIFRGSLDALSLSVRLTDLNGKLLYSKRAGIELLSHYTGRYFVKQTWSQVLLNEDQAVVRNNGAETG